MTTSTDRTTALSRNISELKSWNNILKNIRNEEISIISHDIQKLLADVCDAQINGSRVSQLSVLQDLILIRAEREALRYREGAEILNAAIRERLQALKSPPHTIAAGVTSASRKRARYESPPRRDSLTHSASPPRSISRSRRASPPYCASSPHWVSPPGQVFAPYYASTRPGYASPPRYARRFRRKRSLSPLRRTAVRSASPRVPHTVGEQPPQKIGCYRYSVLGTRVRLYGCDLVYRPGQGCYILYEGGADHYEEYKDENGVVQTLRLRSVQRVEYEEDFYAMHLDVVCGFRDEVRTITIVFNDVRDCRELVAYLMGLEGVVVEKEK